MAYSMSTVNEWTADISNLLTEEEWNAFLNSTNFSEFDLSFSSDSGFQAYNLDLCGGRSPHEALGSSGTRTEDQVPFDHGRSRTLHIACGTDVQASVSASTWLTEEGHKTSSSRRPVDLSQMALSEESKAILTWRDVDGHQWKTIAELFQERFGQEILVPALQMRFKRAKARTLEYLHADQIILKRAYQYWLDHKFKIICQKMVDFGAHDTWSPSKCAQKLRELQDLGFLETGV